MHPILFKIGSINIYTYGFFVFLGILSAYLFLVKEFKREGISLVIAEDLFFWVIIISMVSARLTFILLNFNEFINSPLSFLFSGSGFVFYGGFIGGLITGIIFLKKKKLPILRILDVVSPAIPLGHSLGRIGCFSYGCCYGKPTTSFWGVLFPPDSPAGMTGLPVIPTQLISSFFLLVIFVILLLVRDRKIFRGGVFVTYLFLYGIFRFLIEFIRGDERGFFWIFSISQWLAMGFIILSLFLTLKLKSSSPED